MVWVIKISVNTLIVEFNTLHTKLIQKIFGRQNFELTTLYQNDS
jgi:hypothetical protein